MRSFFVFDVESIGLHGEGFAVAGGVYLENGAAQWEFCFACPSEQADGTADDRTWVGINVPVMEITHRSTHALREAFWKEWQKAQAQGAMAAAECLWPVEGRFFSCAVAQDEPSRKFTGPYPFLEISSVLIAAGMDPMKEYTRHESEMPKHNPLADARQSARLLSEALAKLAKTPCL